MRAHYLAALATITIATPLAFGQATDNPYDGLERRDGLLTVHVDPAGGKVLLTLPAATADGMIGRFIYAIRITSGVGSNPLGLDRGLGDSGRLLLFRRIGDHVIAEIENVDYRANSADPAERRAVAESFARSIIWSGAIVDTDAAGRTTVDVSSFITRDAFNVATQLADRGQGSFSLDSTRSFPTPNALAFPDNVELEALLTFASSKPGDEIQATTPEPEALTIRMHHSLVRLPDSDYVPRRFDPRSASIDMLWYDFAQPLTEPLAVRVSRRYRLQKLTPGSAAGPVKKPIVFYVDPGAPEPIRSALIDGASWWAEAFSAAGFEDAYRVELLPDDAHPADVRYNVIQWVHRQTRGWSYGGGVADPRTGEMLKGHVILGSQRVRQDRMIFESMVGAAENGSGSRNDPTQVALARIRQLAAHEVGHALGFHHNMAASTNDRASVMDYPAPLITLDRAGQPDLGDAYSVGVGAWDKFTVAWLYSEFDDGVDEQAGLDALFGQFGELRYVADQHARSVSNPFPYGSVWDNGENAIDELDRTLAIRAAALAKFGARRLGPRREIADLTTLFAPLYLYHRYQVDAAAKYIGGLRCLCYPIRDDATPSATQDRFAASSSGSNWIDPKLQRRALQSLLRTVHNDTLAVPQRIIQQFAPSLNADEPIMGRERFGSRLGPVFDRGYAAQAAARLTFKALLVTPRLNRLHNSAWPSETAASPFTVAELLSTTSDAVFDDYADTITGHAVRDEYLTQLFALLHDSSAMPGVRATVLAELAQRERRLKRADGTLRWFAERIRRELQRPLEPMESTQTPTAVPPGSPIGSADYEGCWHCDSAELLGL